MTSQDPAIILYDIVSEAPLRTFAPNPWKTRFALNLKRVPYETRWLELAEIGPLRERLGLRASRSHADGTAYPTLPVMHDRRRGEAIGDSFEIALYLERHYPADADADADVDRPQPLFRPLTTGLTAAFNAHVDGIFTAFAALCDGMPLTAQSRDVFLRRTGKRSWAEFQLPAEERARKLVSFEAAMGELAKAYRHTGGATDYIWRPTGTDTAHLQRPPPERRDEAGPFLDGDAPVYADFIVGAWLKMMQASLGHEDWQRFRSWQGSLWARILDRLEEWSEIN